MSKKRREEPAFEPREAVAEKSKLTALRDFVIHQNEFHLEIKAGDDLSDVPAVYLANLVAEGVIKGGQ